MPSPLRGECTPCPEGAVCDGTAHVVAKDGWYALDPPQSFQRCIKPAACEKRAPGALCAANYTGPLCSLCDPGFGNKFDFKCKPCKTKVGGWALGDVDPIWWLIVYVILSAAVAGFFSKLTIDQAEFEIRAWIFICDHANAGNLTPQQSADIGRIC